MDRNTNDLTLAPALTTEEFDAAIGGQSIVSTVVNAVVDGINALLGHETVCNSKSCVTF